MNSEVIKSFLKAVRPQLILFTGMVALFSLVYLLSRIPVNVLLYGIELAVFLFAVYLVVQYIRYARRYKLIQDLQSANASSLEDFPAMADPADELYIGKMKSLLGEIRELQQLHAERQADQLDYFTLWLHQIKTPISALSLLNQSSHTKETRQISQELLRLEDYTHMALNYVKLEETGTEMELTEVALDDVIKKAVKKYSILFIYKGIKLDYEPLDLHVLSDGQWLQVLVEQVLSNSLKYTPDGTISIYRDPGNDQTLVIEDTGIGIRPEDLPKIFNKGYSGLSGRLHEKSTGLGLFLSKKICERLGHHLDIESELGKGTRVSIDMAREKIEVFD